MANINTETTSDLKDSLEEFSIKLAKMKKNSFFTNVSDHTQHNRFYGFCSDKLSVKRYLEEVKDRISELKDQNIIELYRKIEAQNREIKGDIESAQRMQRAVMPEKELMKKIHPHHFLFYEPMPLHIVSGDFYWATQKDNWSVVVAADCTGHGVRGALLSMLGISILNEIVLKQEITTASDILGKLRRNLILNLKQTGVDGEHRDGMDVAICLIDYEQKKMQYSGAYNPLYLVRNGKLEEYEANKMPVGIFNYNSDEIYNPDKEKDFTNHIIQLQPGDMLYIFSDGYASQLNKNRKRFQSKKFKEMLKEISPLPTEDQKERIEEEHKQWKGDRKQTDDIIVIGIKI
jgi:serine phosphatase RsbU (regulator of sigma subunit)